MTPPFCSVVIPTYNRPSLLPRAVGSVLASSVQDFEVVVVNDGGLSPSLPSDRRIRLVEQPNGGLSSARNFGIVNARGRVVTFLDDDDVITQDRLAIAQESVARGANVSVCSKNFGEDATRDMKTFLVGGGFHPGQFAVLRAVCPMFDEDYRISEDVEWVIRLCDVSNWLISDRLGYIMCDHGSPRLTDDFEGLFHARRTVIVKHAKYFDEHPDALVYQWKSLGVLALRRGELELARQAFGAALGRKVEARSVLGWAATWSPWTAALVSTINGRRSGM